MLTQTAKLLFLIGFLFSLTAAAQSVKTLDDAGMERKGIELLREVISDIPNLKSPVNRFYFANEAAKMIWPEDEKLARQIVEGLMGQVRSSASELAVEAKKPGAMITAENNLYDEIVSDVISDDDGESKPSEKLNSQLTMKLSSVVQMRNTLVTSVVVYDPELAFQFYKETAVPMAGLTKFHRGQSFFFPLRMNAYGSPINSIADGLIIKGKREQALEFAYLILSGERSTDSLKAISKIVEAYPDKGKAIFEEVYNGLTKPGLEKSDSQYLKALFDLAVRSRAGRQNILLTDMQLKSVAKLLGQEVLKLDEEHYTYPSPLAIAKRIERYAPVEAVKIRRKFASRARKGSLDYDEFEPGQVVSANRAPASNTAANAANSAARAAAAAANAVAYASNSAANATYRSKRGTGKVKPPPAPKKSRWQINAEIKQGILEKLQKAGHTSEERRVIVAECRKYVVSQNWLSPFQGESGVGLVAELVAFSMVSADKQLADDILQEAEAYVPTKLVTFSDYGARLFVAMGHSQRNPTKSFEMLESMTSINEVIEAAMKLGQFVDITTMFITEGEANLGMLPFQSLGTEIALGGRASGFSNIFRDLAKADFDRTKALANKFQRKELQIAMKMLIAISALNKPSADGNGRGAGIDFSLYGAIPSLYR